MTLALSHALNSANALLQEELERFETILKEALEEQESYLTSIEYDLYKRGKRLRPILLLLSAHITQSCLGIKQPLTDKVIQAAVSLEMLHVATLIHDDIIDKASRRRGLVSVNAERGNELAILIGDLQFVQAISCFSRRIDSLEDLDFINHILKVGFKLCCGEIDELMTISKNDTEYLLASYKRTIDRKTAQLFALACEAGAVLAKGRHRIMFYLSHFGRLIGKAFQIMDDLNDFLDNGQEADKTRFTDLQQKRLSLPIIYALEELPDCSLLHRYFFNNESASSEDITNMANNIVSSNGFIRAYNEAYHFTQFSFRYLEEFPISQYQEIMAELARSITT